MRTCGGCQTVVMDGAGPCPKCGQLVKDGVGTPARTIVRPAGRPRLPVEVEIAYDIDVTGSSDAFKVGIAKSVEIVNAEVGAKARSVKVWVVTHGDEEFGQMPGVVTAGGTPEDALADVKRIVFGGGEDDPETHLSGIEYAFTTTPWTQDPRLARGALVSFLTDDTKPLASGKSARQLGEEIRSRGVLLYLVCQETPALRELAEGAGGMIVPLSNDPSREELARVSAAVAASITATVGAGSTVPLSATTAARV